MSRRMPGHGPTRRMVLAVRTVKVAGTSAAAVTAIVLTLGGALASPGEQAPRSEDASVRLAERSGLDARCVGADGQALVLTAEGETRIVPFERAWKIYRGEKPGTLLAVCPD
jgi:uncharacterized membrane protein YjjP (DUF1212 family)